MTDCGNTDLFEVASGETFAATLDRLLGAIAHAGMTLFARIDHAAGALAVGTPIRPATVLIYGSPAGGTPLMIAAPLAALELPLRVLIRENDAGKVSLVFHPIAPVLREAGVPEALVHRLDRAQLMLAEALA